MFLKPLDTKKIVEESYIYLLNSALIYLFTVLLKA